jgi:Mn2+/Fe2+ NRAMP family transporter
MGFGGFLSIAVLIAAALVLHPNGVKADNYNAIATIVSTPLGKAGFWIFCVALFIACFGAALELSLDIAYVYAQVFGWTWGENKKPADAARFAATYTLFIPASALLVLIGLDPLKLTLFSMALTVLVLPLVVLPFLVLMNDPKHVREHGNSPFGNSIVFVIVILSFVMAVAAIPLQIFGGS